MRDRTTSVKRHPVDDVAPEGTNVLLDVWLTSRAVTGRLDEAIAASGLTADEFGIYSALSSADTITPSELAQWMFAPTTTVSSVVKRLEKRGHLERERNPDDGRSYLLRLTPSGRKAHAAAGKLFAPVLHQVVGDLGRHEPTVRKELQRLRRAVDNDNDNSPAS